MGSNPHHHLPSPRNWSFTRTKSGQGIPGLAPSLEESRSPPAFPSPEILFSALFCLFQFMPLVTASLSCSELPIKIPEHGLENLPRNMRRKCSSCLCNKGSFLRGQEPRTVGDKSPHTPKGGLTDRRPLISPSTPSLAKRRPGHVCVCVCVCEHVNTQVTHSLAWVRLRMEEVSGQRGGWSVRMTGREGSDCKSAQVQPFPGAGCTCPSPRMQNKAWRSHRPCVQEAGLPPEWPATPQGLRRCRPAGVSLHGPPPLLPQGQARTLKGRCFSRSVCDSHSGPDRSGACS